MTGARRVRVIDSHTGGEPTRLVVSGGPGLGSGPLSRRLERFRSQHDCFRSAVVNEPRGSDVMVGALLCDAEDASSAAGVIFFNNVGYLGMCGHGTIGLIASLSYLGRIGPGEHRIETPVGTVSAILHESGKGNWFFLAHDHGVELMLKNVEELTTFTWAIRQALRRNGIAGASGEEIDHIELFGPSPLPGVDSRNFVLCPGKAYDRSPCGTGTSAKLACLYADGKIREGETWKQESIVGSVFEGRVKLQKGKIYPSITGSAFVNAEAELVLDPRDPLCMGIRT